MHPVLNKCPVLFRSAGIVRPLTTASKVFPDSPRNNILRLAGRTSEQKTAQIIPSKEWHFCDTGNRSTAPRLLLGDFPTNFQKLCSITPVPLPSGQYPFIMPVPIPVEMPRIGGLTINQKLPSIWNTEKCDPLPEAYREIIAPTMEHLKIQKQAARLIRIRRSKMKKHQYKKLKKRYGRVWAKFRRRRWVRRMQAFDDSLREIIRLAKEFDPEAYVKNYIATAKECEEKKTTITKRKGSRFDEFKMYPYSTPAPFVPKYKKGRKDY